MKIKELKDELKKMSHEEKDELFLKIFKIKEWKNIIKLLFWKVDYDEFLEKSIAKIDRYIFWRSWIVLKKWEAKKAISEYKKNTWDEIWEIKLMLYYVERMEKFTRDYWDIDERFYVSVEDTYLKALKLIDKNKKQKDFYGHVTKIRNKIVDFWYWWWFSDWIDYYYSEWVDDNKWNF